MANEFTVSMSLENIGPHCGENRILFSESFNSNKVIFYATNGTGKSFISRAFRLCTTSKTNMIVDEVLTVGEQEGYFSFEIRSKGVDKKLNITIRRGMPPVVNNSSDFLFHVFNSDYVEENIKAKHYSPDGRIEGYILGKIQIDLTEEYKNLEILSNEICKDNETIDKAIEDAKSFLIENGVKSTTKEFSAITRDNVERGFGYERVESVDECIQKIKTLESVPDDFQDIRLSLVSIDMSFLNEIEDILKTVYPKSEWDEKFVAEYKAHQQFIKTGLECAHSDKICPFCKRTYDSEALKLINMYNQYRQDQEAKIVEQLQHLQRFVADMSGKLDAEQRNISDLLMKLREIQKYFSSLSDLEPKIIIKIENYKKIFKILVDMISQKIDNLSLPIDSLDVIASCKNAWAEISKLQEYNKSVVAKANKTKNDTRSERLSLRRSLCKAKSLLLQNELSDLFKKLKEKTATLKKLKEEIIKKEQKARVSKREKVYETLVSALNRFFNGKYQIDKDSFQIKFLGNTVGNNASSILSDGEKSIVAFCWYLAETHTIVNSEDDYNKLFFIIDDPISSMDFHFVYAVAQVIRDIKSIFNISSYERIWIFTHSNEFFSIVTRNNILAHAFMMKPGSIKKINNQLLMPYNNHLLDLDKIVNDSKTPNHTTGNSIRHVIETIAKFENPKISLDKYVRDNEMLSKDSCVFSLCQDLSHGNVRLETPYNEEVLREAARTVIEFIKVNYPGQLEAIR